MTKKDDADIEQFLRSVVERVGQVDDGTHRMFRLLVRTTLKFRDDLRTTKGEVLTVGETQKALDAFMEVMKTHEIPTGLDAHAHDLIIRWLEEIRQSVHH